MSRILFYADHKTTSQSFNNALEEGQTGHALAALKSGDAWLLCADKIGELLLRKSTLKAQAGELVGGLQSIISLTHIRRCKYLVSDN
jgi:uncharacterized protein (DUF2237 family)